MTVPRPRLIALGAVAALVLGVVPATAAVSANPVTRVPAASAQQSPGNSGTHTVTLITGDKVTIGTAADGTVVRSFEAANGAGAGFHRAVIDGATYVYPDAVLPYVGAGKLDKQLFNVTRLIADGYDDARASRLPLIVSYTDAATRSRARPKVAGSSVVRRLDVIQGAALAQSRKQAPVFWSALTGGPGAAARTAKPAFAGGIAKVWLDSKVKADLADSTAQIGAQQVWAEGNSGKGVTVAVLDSGVDAEHPDLTGQVDTGASFVPHEEDTADYNGHGTHVASTIAGTGGASGGKERGVASGARPAIGKVLDSDGRGQESWIIAGMEWAARDQRARIISMSLGGGGDATDPMSQAVDTLSHETGALFVVAAGNGGPDAISSPGAADAALTVGAVDSEDRLADSDSQAGHWSRAVAGDGGGVGTSAADPVGDATGAVLYRDGQKIEEMDGAWSDVEVPADRARYRLDLATSRNAQDWKSGVATSTSWSFPSGRTDTATPLSLLQLDYDVPVDARNAIHAGRAHTIGVRVRLQDGLSVPRGVTVRVEASYDDGRTWRRAEVTDRGHNAFRARIEGPSRSRPGSWVTLRVTARDAAGNSVRQTVQRAYALHP
ncbi:S8 family serine peptidase [Streptomyces sp. Ncost-T10-10d]|uniref:S8 family serine peptidase n=1 Tax=Streptomyces sp. Ncost-T10-10d TaxID=1839774 RepID=UPI000B80FB5C|nr:S8 family serine peptidase [Streptomyces sp. Ncost-T10-10d]